MAEIKRVKGFSDLFEPDSTTYSFIENTARRVFGAYGYRELRTPILEQTELFTRGIGTETDVVQKEMYTFVDKGDRSITMRPEATAGVMRAYIENNCYTQSSVSKYFTYGPMFRYERPQKGRLRQFHQLNCECIGATESYSDAETVLMLARFLRELGLNNITMELNSLGCRECRPVYNQTLKEFLAGLNTEELCENCQRRMETNPLRVLDCKVPTCRELTKDAPQILSCNCDECASHFSSVRQVLDQAKQEYVVNPRLVRGLDYYTRTTFEAVSNEIGSQGSVAGGGRYDGLVKQLGGPDVPGTGFACGIDRLAMLIGAKEAPVPDFYLAILDEAGLSQGLVLAQELREAGLSGEVTFTVKSLKSQMRQASKNGARKCLILGEDELAAGTVTVKDMQSGEQQSLSPSELPAALE